MVEGAGSHGLKLLGGAIGGGRDGARFIVGDDARGSSAGSGRGGAGEEPAAGAPPTGGAAGKGAAGKEIAEINLEVQTVAALGPRRADPTRSPRWAFRRESQMRTWGPCALSRENLGAPKDRSGSAPAQAGESPYRPLPPPEGVWSWRASERGSSQIPLMTRGSSLPLKDAST